MFTARDHERVTLHNVHKYEALKYQYIIDDTHASCICIMANNQ
jgi:hypothetical protein